MRREVFQNSGGVSGNYGNNQTCIFLIQPGGGGSAITLSFSDFSTENIANTDVLRVYDGVDATGTLLGEFWGVTMPPDLVANSGSMFLRWTSDASNTYPGYIASWTSAVFTPTPTNTPTSTPNRYTDTYSDRYTDTYTYLHANFIPKTPTETLTPTRNSHSDRYSFAADSDGYAYTDIYTYSNQYTYHDVDSSSTCHH